MLSASAKIFQNRLRFDKVTESLKVGTFLRHSAVFEMSCLQDTDTQTEGQTRPST